MDLPITEKRFAIVRTTLPVPYPPMDQRPSIRTERLLLRPYQESDLEAYYQLRQQPEVMMWTAQGGPDQDREASRAHLAKKLAPEGDRTYEFAICDGQTGELIGMGGSHEKEAELGWPIIGYMFRKEAWGKGYATEFVKGFLDAWWNLPRMNVEISVDQHTLEKSSRGSSYRECIIAVTVDANKASHNVLRKTGWEHVKTWEEQDYNKPEMISLNAWVVRPRSIRLNRHRRVS